MDPKNSEDDVPLPSKETTLSPLPQAEISEMLGLIELLNNKGGKEDIYKLAQELQMEFGKTLQVIKAAETLGLVYTPGGDVVLEKLGESLTKLSINDRKDLLAEKIAKLPLFQAVYKYIDALEDKEADRDDVLQKLSEIVPSANAEKTFALVVNWGRFAEVFGYNDNTQIFYIDLHEDEAASGI